MASRANGISKRKVAELYDEFIDDSSSERAIVRADHLQHLTTSARYDIYELGLRHLSRNEQHWTNEILEGLAPRPRRL